MTRNIKEIVNQHGNVHAPIDPMGADHVVVLLAHFNGERVLGDQLQSLAQQSHRNWSLLISDDGSADGWMSVATDFVSSDPARHVLLVNGPQQGFARNFLSLLKLAGPTVPFAAFCDQDDVWMPGKLEIALRGLKSVPQGKPGLYCGRTTICDANMTPRRPSPLFGKSPCFRNALVQSIGGGNTMVVNRAALDLLQDTLPHAQGIVSHDWWVYQIVTGAGGEVIYDTEPQVLYRQHSDNLVGANDGWTARMVRLRSLMQGRFRTWNDAHFAALKGAQHWLTEDAQRTLDTFHVARHGSLWRRLAGLHASGVHRQTSLGQLALWMAGILKRL
ncbi:MAG: glycosyltransferase family 2 protein [Pseudomonadota bacterium]